VALCSSSPRSPPVTEHPLGHRSLQPPSVPQPGLLQAPGRRAGQGAAPGAGTGSSWHSPSHRALPGPAGTRVRRAACRGVPRACPKLAQLAQPAPGLPCGCLWLPQRGPGAITRCRMQGWERDAPWLGTASRQAPCGRGCHRCHPAADPSPGVGWRGPCHGEQPGTPRAPPLAGDQRPDAAPCHPRMGFRARTAGGRRRVCPRGRQHVARMGARGSAPSFPCRAAIPLYDTDTGLLVLAGKVRSHGSGVQGGARGCGGVLPTALLTPRPLCLLPGRKPPVLLRGDTGAAGTYPG